MVDVQRLWDEAEVVWGEWHKGWGLDGGIREFRTGYVTIRREDLSTDDVVVMEHRVYLQTHYPRTVEEKAP